MYTNSPSFFWKSWNGEEFTESVPETESRNSEDHKFWNHEMRGSPVDLGKIYLLVDFVSSVSTQ